MRNNFSATEFLENAKSNMGCIACRYFKETKKFEICLKTDKFILPEFRPYNCSNYEEIENE